MEILRHAVVLVHIVGFAVLFGSWVVSAVGERRVTQVMNWGLVIALVSGLALAAPWGTDGLNYTKLGVKFAVLLAIGALIGIGLSKQRKTDAVPPALFWAIGILALLNAGIAVLWR